MSDKELTVDELYQKLIDEGEFTEEELNLVCNLNGYSVDTLNDCIYARTGYQDYFQLFGWDEDDYEAVEEDDDPWYDEELE